MTYKFKVSVTTALGSCVADGLCANSAQQISDSMPDGVTIYETTFLGAADVAAPVDDDDVFVDLQSMVDNIRTASEMTPERVAEEHTKQARALAGMVVTLR